jgi:putative membrane protein
MMNGGMMNGLSVLWVALILALIALAVVAIVWLVRTMSGPSRGTISHSDLLAARAELDRRDAAGDLSREDYLQRRQDIEG